MRGRDQRALTEVSEQMAAGKYELAAGGLAKLLSRYPGRADLHYLSAELESFRGYSDRAIAAALTGIEVEPGGSARGYSLLGKLYTDAADFSAAATAYQNYLAQVRQTGRSHATGRAEQLLAQALMADSLAADAYPIDVRPVGGGINTAAHLEYFPSLSVDGRRMIFTRRVHRRQEDFYQSERLADGSWAEAVALAGVNTPENEGGQSVTATADYLVFTACGRPDGAGGCDLYASERIGQRWSDAKNLGPAINGPASESQPSLSRDGRLLFLASNRAGGLGQDDLYVCGRLPDGRWSRPVNLGPAVNTPGNDRYPFWAADDRTLYFTSDGRPGMGGADLFRTGLDTANQWTGPVNLGYPINTPGQESNLYVGLDGTSAYFSKGIGDDIDIYTFELPERHRPLPATYVTIRVVDAATGSPLRATVRLQKQSGKNPVTAYTTDRLGNFLTVLPLGTDYGLSVTHPGYLFYNDRFALAELRSIDEPFELTVRLQPLAAADVANATPRNEEVVLRNVFFATASASLLPASTEELDRLQDLLTEAVGKRVEIAGHTDNVGGEDDNQRLSERRAEAVRQYLIEAGTAAERIVVRGFGETRPVADNTTAEGRSANRRTTFRLLD